MEGAGRQAAGAVAGALRDPLAPYVPRLVVDWLAEEPDREHRRVPGSFLFADISGFTNLTERLAAARGKAGAEEMGELLNGVFDDLLTAAYDHGANLIKWGGDAVLLLFDAADGADHAVRATVAAAKMQSVMRRIGRLETSGGVVRLGMSIGVHTGAMDFLLVGSQHRELVVTGPAATVAAQMEKAAGRGEVLLSPQAAMAVPSTSIGRSSGPGILLATAPELQTTPNRTPKRGDVDLGVAMSPHVRDHLRSGVVEHEHRSATVGFIEFSGADDVLDQHGSEALVAAVRYVIDAVQEAAHANDVTLLATDLAENGGKIILTSGVPRAVGDDETRVLSTVRRVVHPGGRLGLRAGITCGGVFAGDYGPFYRKTYSIAGDVVNLAARLMAKAAPGQVLATPAVIERSRTTFDTTPLAPFSVKGKAEPVEAVLVGDLRRESDPVIEDRLPLLGRDADLQALLDAARRAEAGRGTVVDIVGPAGIGKSRLIEELGDRTSARVLWTDGDIYGRATPYQPLQRLLRRTLALPVQVDDATLSAALIDLVGGSAPDLLPWLPLIGIVAGVDIPATPEVDRLDPGVRRAKAESATSELLGKLLSSPTVLVLNDVHFMDEATLGLVRRLATDAKDRPWLIITTRRPTVDSPADPAPHVQTLELSPLEPASAEHLLAAATQEAPLPAHQLRRLTERAGGNPLFLTRLVRAALSGADLDALPDSLEGMIAAQIDRLPSPRRRWLRAASVLGMVVDPTWLEAMLAGSDLADQTWSGLEDFISMHLDSRLRFTHHLIRLTAYEGLPYRRRTELHARAADILEAALGRRTGQYATLLSLHCLHGGRYAAAWRYSRTAGDQARAQYAPSEAAECYRRALTAAKSVPDLDPMQVADVYAALAEVSMDLGEMPQAENALRQARRFARTDATRLARLQLTTARHRQHVGKHRDALRWVARGRATLARSEDPVAQRVRVELAERGALIRYDQGAYRAAMTWAARAVDEARSVGDEDLEARALGVLVGQAALAGMPVDESKAQESLDRYERAGDLRGKARTSNALGVWAYFAGRWDEAVGYYAEAERASAQIGREFDAAAAAANRAEVLIQQGRTEEAGAVLEPAVRTLLAANATSFLAFTVGLSGRVALARGDYAAAMDKLAEARAMCLEMGETGEAIALEAHCAQVYLRAGEIDQALRQVEETAERASGAGQGAVAAAHLHRVRGEALLARGQRDQGAQELRAALEVAREHDTSYEVEASLRALLECQVAASPAEAGAWRAEREALAVRLGIIG